jgi:hypothetical protein
MGVHKEIKAFLGLVQDQGGFVDRRGSHIVVRAGSGRGMVSVNCSQVNPRIIKDVRSDLRRAGYVIP